MLEKLLDHNLWLEYLNYKLSKRLLLPREEKHLINFIENKNYLPIANKIVLGEFHFTVPTKSEINKIATNKKRIVYSFPDDENMILKMLSYLLYKYDNSIPNNCYSFRKNTGVRNAFMEMLNAYKSNEYYGYKSDISNYFNSIDVSILLPILKNTITDDLPLLNLLEDLLCDDRAIWNGELIHEQRGVMAGTPTAPFLANLYLIEMDKYFENNNVIYARYSDDILIFSHKDELSKNVDIYKSFLDKYKLCTNPSKEKYFLPYEKWEFLGFSYNNGTIDISEIAARKMLDKIRRAAKSIRRWTLQKDVAVECALNVFNRKMNKKFYNINATKELSWCRWYFPIINTDRTLHYIDHYMQDWQRYIVTGKHNKANYKKVPYTMLKEHGYKPLVAEYYSRPMYPPQ